MQNNPKYNSNTADPRHGRGATPRPAEFSRLAATAASADGRHSGKLRAEGAWAGHIRDEPLRPGELAVDGERAVNPQKSARDKLAWISDLGLEDGRHSQAAAEGAGRAPLRPGELAADGIAVSRKKVDKHFAIEVTDAEIRWSRKQDKINAEAQLDGIYVIRTSLQSSALGAPRGGRGLQGPGARRAGVPLAQDGAAAGGSGHAHAERGDAAGRPAAPVSDGRQADAAAGQGIRLARGRSGQICCQ